MALKLFFILADSRLSISFPEPTCLLVSTKTRSSGIIKFQRPRSEDFRLHGACVAWFIIMASIDKVDVDMFHKGIQYALESLGESKFGFESTTVSNFKGKSHEGSGNELVDYSVLLVGCGKKSQISQDFQGQIRGKNGRFRGNFARDFPGKFR